MPIGIPTMVMYIHVHSRAYEPPEGRHCILTCTIYLVTNMHNIMDVRNIEIHVHAILYIHVEHSHSRDWGLQVSALAGG